MVTEDYISFETAKLLKEKGFDVSTEHDMWYVVEKFSTGCHWNSCTYKVGDITREYNEKCCIAMPTLQMAMKWLREEHNKIIVPSIRVIDPITGIIDCYCIGIYYTPKNNGGALCFISPTPENGYSSYEEACEEGIKYCLENLI